MSEVNDNHEPVTPAITTLSLVHNSITTRYPEVANLFFGNVYDVPTNTHFCRLSAQFKDGTMIDVVIPEAKFAEWGLRDRMVSSVTGDRIELLAVNLTHILASAIEDKK